MSPLREIRRRRRMTQTQLAECIGVTQSHIAQIERGKRRGSIAVLQKLAVALNVSLTDLLPPECANPKIPEKETVVQ
ncbi:helix-turn-helix transcriptional regulator [Sulfobacillus thermosulfidooxidans]|uniref:helix-turn-helix transcriptional regulator n=1 Tax=Sulfobacillus thermosulfidooxidans TaxID=28034 RepID=UPI0006B63101|nr:helix-turn-helix transcriptional regulator [Sulfobacillus thermosulfidooxidans]